MVSTMKNQNGLQAIYFIDARLLTLITNDQMSFTYIVGYHKDQYSGLYCFSYFLDLSEAFDTISHNVLLHKLKAYSINNEELEWFASIYFTDARLLTFITKYQMSFIYIVESHKDQYSGLYCFSYFLMIFLMHSKSRES